MLFFILLAGVRESTPLNEIFFIQFDTNTISSSLPNPVRWTLYNYCGVSSNGKNINCSSNSAGIAFQPQVTLGTSNGIPSDIINNRDTYYYLTKIGFAFYLITASFVTISLFSSIFSCFSRLGGAVAAFFGFLALLFSAAASAMMTAAFVMARNAFTDDNIASNLGVKAFAFTWAVTASLLLSFLLLCCSCVSAGSSKPFGRRHKSGNEESSTSPLKRESSFERVYDNDKPRGRGFFNVSRRKEEQPTSFFAENTTNPPPQGPLVVDART
jgi:hypothetical protein